MTSFQPPLWSTGVPASLWLLVTTRGHYTPPSNRKKPSPAWLSCIPAAAPGAQVDGGNPRRHGGGQRCGVRGQIHAALVIFRGGGGREAYGATPAQYVGDERQGGGSLDHHRRRQMGRNRHCGRFALPAPALDRR